MALRQRGKEPAPGDLDRRYLLIDLQVRGRRVRISSGSMDRAAAQAKEQLLLDELRADPSIPHGHLVELVRGGSRTPSRTVHPSGAAILTLKEACDQALDDHEPWGRSRHGWAESRSHATYSEQLRDIQRILGPSLPVTSIDRTSLDTVIKDLLGTPPGARRPRNSRSTANRKMFALLSVLRRLNERGLAALKIPRYAPFDESDNARQFVFTAEQERELFNRIKHLDATESMGRPRVLDAHAYHDLFVFLADTGCRLTAALKVRWTDVFTDNGATLVRFFRKQHLKGGRPRTTPLTKRAAEALNRQEKGGTEGPFTLLNKRRAQHLWKSAKGQTSFANERDAVIHSLRHTCATRMLLATGDIKLVQEWLGHSALQTTADIYAKVLITHKLSALPSFEDRWNS